MWDLYSHNVYTIREKEFFTINQLSQLRGTQHWTPWVSHWDHHLFGNVSIVVWATLRVVHIWSLIFSYLDFQFSCVSVSCMFFLRLQPTSFSGSPHNRAPCRHQRHRDMLIRHHICIERWRSQFIYPRLFFHTRLTNDRFLALFSSVCL